VALKIRVMASHGSPGRGGLSALIYRAEAYEDNDRFRERKWGCSHEHRTIETAVQCGQAWLDEHLDDLTETA